MPVFSCGPMGLATSADHENRGTPGQSCAQRIMSCPRYVTCTKMVHDYVQCTTMVHAYVMCTNMVHAPTWCALAWCVHQYGACALPWGACLWASIGRARGGMSPAGLGAAVLRARHGAAWHGMAHAWPWHGARHAWRMPWHSMAHAVPRAGRWHDPCMAHAVPMLHCIMARCMHAGMLRARNMARIMHGTRWRAHASVVPVWRSIMANQDGYARTVPRHRAHCGVRYATRTMAGPDVPALS